MSYSILVLAHIIGTVLIGAGLIGVWICDLRSRQVQELIVYSEAIRNIEVFYDGLVVPGALLLLVSGSWMIASYYDGLSFLQVPWLAGMVILFLFEFIEGNTVTRLYFTRLSRLTGQSLEVGCFTEELNKAREQSAATFTHFLDIPILLIIVSLGSLKPQSWSLFFYGSIVAILTALLLTIVISRLYTRSDDVFLKLND